MTAFPIPDDWENWSEQAKEELLKRLKEYQSANWHPFYCPNRLCDGEPHNEWDFSHARADQRPPKWSDNWLTWVLKSGRGAGKTRTGSETVHQVADLGISMALIGATGPALREVMIEGPSGIIATSPPGKRPIWEPSRRRLIWPNGAIAWGMSAEEPDRVRGLNIGFAWLDEASFMPQIEEVWANLMLALRIGINPHIIVTTTPTPSNWLRKLIADPLTITTTVSTYANLKNLSPVFREKVLEQYEGTRRGRQELHGEIIDDVEGALWSIVDLDRSIVDHEWARDKCILFAVGVDPPSGPGTCGIVVVGKDEDGVLYVLDDYSIKDASPNQWATAVSMLANEYQADVVAEINQGGKMVKEVLQQADASLIIKEVRAAVGKQTRAQPIALLWEKEVQKGQLAGKSDRLKHLITQMAEWVPGQRESPDRVDAMVWAGTYLLGSGGKGMLYGPSKPPTISPNNSGLASIRAQRLWKGQKS